MANPKNTIYKYDRKTGTKVKMKPTEIKATTMKIRGWTEQQYNRERYLLKNKLRALETLTKVPEAERQSPASVLYKEAKAMQAAKKRGEEYQPSLQMQRIKSMPATGNVARFEQQLSSPAQREKLLSRYASYTNQRFAGLIAKDPVAAEIAANVTDPVKREQALIAYANARHIVNDEKKHAVSSEAIPVGESFGSDPVEFDYSSYMTED